MENLYKGKIHQFIASPWTGRSCSSWIQQISISNVPSPICPICRNRAVDDMLLCFIARVTKSASDGFVWRFLIPPTVHWPTSKFEDGTCVFKLVLEEITLPVEWTIVNLFGFWLTCGIQTQTKKGFVPDSLFCFSFPGGWNNWFWYIEVPPHKYIRNFPQVSAKFRGRKCGILRILADFGGFWRILAEFGGILKNQMFW